MKKQSISERLSIAQPTSALHIPLWLVWAAALGFVLAALGAYGVLNDNEGLYAEIPREMLASGDWRQWVIPHLNGLPYMEKPPLLYWLTALSFSLFGASEWVARLVPALSALGCVALLLRFGEALRRPQAGRLAALMFVSGIGVAVMARTLMFDMLLTVCLTAALMYAYRFKTEHGRGLLRSAYAWLALALLAKGVVAVLLFGLVMTPLLLLDVRTGGDLWKTVRAWLEPGAVAIFLAIAAPWHIAASLVEPIFPWFYFINEHVLRFLGRREPHDYYAGPWWYYLPRMALYLFPWSLLLPALLRRPQSLQQQPDGLRRFLLLAWLLPLAFFSISSAKANYYLVAVMPFAALHLALALERRAFLGAAMRLLPGVLIALLAGALCAAVSLRAGTLPLVPVIAGWTPAQFALWTLGVLTVLALLCSLAAWRWTRVGILAYLALPAWCVPALLVAVQAVEPLVSARPLAVWLQSDMAGRPVYLYRNFEELSALPFYLRHPVGVIDSRSNDLYWGNKLQKNDLLIDVDQFERLSAGGKFVVVVLPRQLNDFKETNFYRHISGQWQIGAATAFFN